MTYPKGYHAKHTRKFILASLLSDVIFSFILGSYFEYKNINIDFNGSTITQIVNQSDGPYTIAYLTTGPIFSSFHMSCTPTGVPDLGPYYNCVELNYDGKPGTVELRIPSGLLSELEWIDKVNVLPFIETSFQLISQDNLYRVFRIDVPPGYQSISLVGGTKMEFPHSFLFSLLILGLWLFLLSWFMLWLLIVKLPKRFSIMMNRFK